MHELEQRDHLVGEHEHRLERQSFAARVEEIFERRTETFHNEHVVIFMRAAPLNVRNANTSL